MTKTTIAITNNDNLKIMTHTVVLTVTTKHERMFAWLSATMRKVMKRSTKRANGEV